MRPGISTHTMRFSGAPPPSAMRDGRWTMERRARAQRTRAKKECERARRRVALEPGGARQALLLSKRKRRRTRRHRKRAGAAAGAEPDREKENAARSKRGTPAMEKSQLQFAVPAPLETCHCRLCLSSGERDSGCGCACGCAARSAMGKGCRELSRALFFSPAFSLSLSSLL